MQLEATAIHHRSIGRRYGGDTGDVGGNIWGDMMRYSEIWGDMGNLSHLLRRDRFFKLHRYHPLRVHLKHRHLP